MVFLDFALSHGCKDLKNIDDVLFLSDQAQDKHLGVYRDQWRTFVTVIVFHYFEPTVAPNPVVLSRITQTVALPRVEADMTGTFHSCPGCAGHLSVHACL